MGLAQKCRYFIAATALGLVAACASTETPRIVENDEHPFPEAMFATLSSLAFPSKDPDFAKALTLYKVRVKGYARPLPVWYWKRPNSKMTFVMLSGYGGEPKSGVLQGVAELLWQQGFSILSIPSSTHPDFSLAASDKRLPGHMPRDLRELGPTLDEVRRLLAPREPQLLTTRWALGGISYGALQTLVEALSPVRHSQINFEAFVAFNPPVKLSYAMDRLDESFARGAPRYLQADGRLVPDLQQKIRATESRQIYVSEILAAFSQEELEFLMAWDFRLSLLKAIAWPHANPTSLSFHQYLDQQLLPSLAPPLNEEQWKLQQDLRNTQGSFETRAWPRSILVYHSLNDPLCDPNDLLWLKERLGPQMQLYRHGGHLGYVWSSRFRADLAESLRPLLESKTVR
jgi:hypothetical protein